jgi:hypothetical protein
MTKKRVLIYFLITFTLVIIILAILFLIGLNDDTSPDSDNEEAIEELDENELIEQYLLYCEQVDT